MHTEDPVITGLRNIYFRGLNKLRWQDYKGINNIRDIYHYKQSKKTNKQKDNEGRKQKQKTR